MSPPSNEHAGRDHQRIESSALLRWEAGKLLIRTRTKVLQLRDAGAVLIPRMTYGRQAGKLARVTLGLDIGPVLCGVLRLPIREEGRWRRTLNSTRLEARDIEDAVGCAD